MSHDPYGQRSQMEHATMVGTLHAQASMIWPLERPLLESIGLPGTGRVLDLGCGTGELTGRIARAWPELSVVGLDLFEGHLRLARGAHPPAEVPNVRFVAGDARATPWEDASFGAVTIRHVLQAVPDPEALLREARRLLRPGGLLYVLAEDYHALLFDVDDPAAARMFLDVAPGVRATGSDLLHGRTVPRQLRRIGFSEIRVRPLVVDTEGVSRETFAEMLRFWRDGYDTFIAEGLGGIDPAVVRARFNAIIDSVLDPERYAAWLLLAVVARKEGG